MRIVREGDTAPIAGSSPEVGQLSRRRPRKRPIFPPSGVELRDFRSHPDVRADVRGNERKALLNVGPGVRFRIKGRSHSSRAL